MLGAGGSGSVSGISGRSGIVGGEKSLSIVDGPDPGLPGLFVSGIVGGFGTPPSMAGG